MPLIYVTGNSGAGKSIVYKELQKRGYEAYDIDRGSITADEDSITFWYNKTTGEQTRWPRAVEDRTKEWYAKHFFKMSRTRVEQIAGTAKAKTVFLCGATQYDNEFWDLFSEVIYLKIDKATLKHRIAARTNNEYGKASDELTYILGRHESLEKSNRKHGAMMINAARPVNVVVDEIVDKAT